MIIEVFNEDKKNYYGNVGYLIHYRQAPNIFTAVNDCDLKIAFVESPVLISMLDSFKTRVEDCKYGVYKQFINDYPDLSYLKLRKSFLKIEY